jgi:hypothetical protein
MQTVLVYARSYLGKISQVRVMLEWIEVLNNSKFFIGIMMILLNIGARYLVDEISTSEEEYSRNLVMRRLAIFAVCFIGTRDVVTSILLTAGFVILAMGVSRRRTLEGMENKAAHADCPAYDTSAPSLFTT